jgi:hypothetical protein
METAIIVRLFAEEVSMESTPNGKTRLTLTESDQTIEFLVHVINILFI